MFVESFVNLTIERSMLSHQAQACRLFAIAQLPGGWGVLGWVSDRDAQHRCLTRNATKAEKWGSKLYILPNFAPK